MALTVNEFLNIALLCFLFASALGAVVVRNLLFSTLLLAIFSLLMATQYLVLGAPDVAMTEAAVGAGVSTILLLLVLSITGERELPTRGNFIVPVLVAMVIGGLLIYSTIDMPLFGSAEAPAQQHLAPYFINESANDTGIPNIVTSVLSSYRGIDTLGEVVVVFTAAICILLLLGKPRKGGEHE